MNPNTTPEPSVHIRQMSVHIHAGVNRPPLAPSLSMEERKYALILAFHNIGNDDRNITEHRIKTAYKAVKKKPDNGIIRNRFHAGVMEKLGRDGLTLEGLIQRLEEMEYRI